MADIIQLLPDSIANQIAAGEVIQRPSSVVKELIENAVDAGSTDIKLVIKNAGKTLIQMIDNGSGMSDTDVRMAFERHATSKIKAATDLFHITTKGFRGEALASIAAIAQVEVSTRMADEELGRKLIIEGSKVKKQEPTQAPQGTTISVKNLFFNIPARRKFLKSDPVELKHIIEEFKRIAMAHPELAFSLYHNDNEVYILPSSNLRQRIVGILGKSSNKKLVPVQQTTEVIDLAGFVGRPESAKRTSGDQYIFVNRRYIKSNYLNHAIRMAYEELIPAKTYPLYVLYLEIDPSKIDINVHPTKTEIKFEDERIIYNYIRVAVKHALGQYSIAPTLDFNSDYNFTEKDRRQKNYDPLNNEYNYKSAGADRHVSGSGSGSSSRYSGPESTSKGAPNWEELYKVLQNTEEDSSPQQESIILSSKITDGEGISHEKLDQERDPYHIHHSYIISQIQSGYLLIDQQSAHERILYERYLSKFKGKKSLTQKELFPRSLDLDNGKAAILNDILDDVNRLGFEVESFGGNTFLIHGSPAELEEGADSTVIIEELIDNYSKNLELELRAEENISRSLAVSAAIKRGKKLTLEEMKLIIDQLFACSVPYKSPTGRKCFIIVSLDEMFNKFSK